MTKKCLLVGRIPQRRLVCCWTVSSVNPLALLVIDHLAFGFRLLNPLLCLISSSPFSPLPTTPSPPPPSLSCCRLPSSPLRHMGPKKGNSPSGATLHDVGGVTAPPAAAMQVDVVTVPQVPPSTVAAAAPVVPPLASASPTEGQTDRSLLSTQTSKGIRATKFELVVIDSAIVEYRKLPVAGSQGQEEFVRIFVFFGVRAAAADSLQSRGSQGFLPVRSRALQSFRYREK